MSLLDEFTEKCTMIEKRRVSDGYGGYTTEYYDGISFKAAIINPNEIQQRVAQVEGVTALYTITTTKDLNLQYHDVLKRESDGKIFRVKSDGDDKKTPKSATLNMRQVSAEEWSLPNE